MPPPSSSSITNHHHCSETHIKKWKTKVDIDLWFVILVFQKIEDDVVSANV
jgi:hypothetical protein